MLRLAEIMNDSPTPVEVGGKTYNITALKMGTQVLIAEETCKIQKHQEGNLVDMFNQFARSLPAVVRCLAFAVLNDKDKIYKNYATKEFSDEFNSLCERIEWESYNGPLIHVLGADLKDGTPIYDIKPYVPFADAHAEARSGFVDAHSWQTLRVVFSTAVEEYLRKEGMDTELLEQLRDVLAQDPRPHYHADPLRVYGMTFAGIDVHFRVEGQTLFVMP